MTEMQCCYETTRRIIVYKSKRIFNLEKYHLIEKYLSAFETIK